MTKKMKYAFLSLFMMLMLIPQLAAAAEDVANSLVGVQGYDLVSYHQNGGPVAGNGNNVVEYDGVTYLFSSKENMQVFEKNPALYLPAYGGYCAYGVALGKKFVGDPTVWKLINGKLYLNLDKRISGLWGQDIPGYIEKANINWEQIKAKPSSQL